MRAAPTALCIIFCLYASPVLAQQAPDFTVDLSQYALQPSTWEPGGTIYPELGAPLKLGTLEIRQSVSTRLRLSLDTQQVHEDQLLMTEVRAPVSNHPRLQFSLKMQVPIMKSDPVSTPLFVEKATGNPYQVMSRKTKAEYSFGLVYRFGRGK